MFIGTLIIFVSIIASFDPDSTMYSPAAATRNEESGASAAYEQEQSKKDIGPTQMPDFSRISGGKLLKTRFFEFLRPIVEAENERVLSQRRFVKRSYIAYKNGWELNEEHISRLNEIASEYRFQTRDFYSSKDFRVLLMRVDEVPETLALIQAANESAWGTSYFAREANNLFGQWCFTEGCGIVPRKRAEDATHEIKKFSSVNEAVRGYIRNLNTHGAYEHFRNLRYKARQNEVPLDSYYLAIGLQKYSERGMEYVDDIRSMISSNKDILAEMN